MFQINRNNKNIGKEISQIYGEEVVLHFDLRYICYAVLGGFLRLSRESLTGAGLPKSPKL